MTALYFSNGPGLNFGTSAQYALTSEATICFRSKYVFFAAFDYHELIRKGGNYILRTGSGSARPKIEWAYWDGTNIRWQHSVPDMVQNQNTAIMCVVTKNDVAGVYFDGVLVSDAASTLAADPRVLTNALEVGNISAGGSSPWAGHVEDLAIFDYAMGAGDARDFARGVSASELGSRSPIFHLAPDSGIRDIARQVVPTIYSSSPTFTDTLEPPQTEFNAFMGALPTSPPPPSTVIQRRTHAHLGTRIGSRQVA